MLTAWQKKKKRKYNLKKKNMNADRSSRIELLNSSNYEVWRIRMKAVLLRHDKWGYVSGSIPEPEAVSGDRATATALSKWKDHDEKALAEIILSVGEAELRSISNCTTSKEAWEKLQSIHASKGPVRKIELLTDVTSFKLEEDDDFRQRLDKFSSAVEQLAGMKIDIPNDMLVVLILKGLPSSYENFRCAMRSKDDLPTTEVLIGKIMDENKSRRVNDLTVDNNALYAGNRQSSNQRRKNPKQKKKYPCYVCGSLDHWASQCPKRSKDSAKNVNIRGENLYIEVATAEEAKNVTSTKRWCLDSGCTTHMCANEELMTDIEQCTATLNMANTASTTAKAKGTAHLIAATKNGKVDVNINNALLVKDLRTNLLSVSKITQNDREVVFRKNEAVIRDLDGNVKLTADRIEDLYYLREAGERVNAATEEIRTSEASLWHARLGHLHMDAVVDLSNEHATGLRPLKRDGQPCDVCQRGKLTTKPFTARTERSSKPLEIVHTDLCQPSRVKSEGGNRYFVTFTDDYSGWCVIHFLKSKDTVFEAFKMYKSFAEKQTGMKIKSLQSDNGREYSNKHFDEYLQREGIQRRLTVPYTPQQNGVAERMNRTIVDMTRCLLIQSGLPEMYWAEAVNTANYLRNRCPSRSHGGKTPYELWYGSKPNLKHLRVFGAKVFVLEKGPNRGKLDDRSVEGKLVGYSETAKAYKVRRNDTGKIVFTRDVTIIEEPVLRQRNVMQMDLDYMHPREDTPEPGREIGCERTPAEREMGPPKRGPGRPSRQKTGRPGRPRKLYRYVSMSSVASSNASSREDLTQDNDEPMDQEAEGLDDAFNQTNDENRGEKGALNASATQIEKLAKSEKDGVENSTDDVEDLEDCDEPMEVKFTQEMAHMADVELEEATKGEHAQEWKHAIAEEVRSHLLHGTWQLVKRPERGRVIDSKVILKNKTNIEGEIVRRKARIVARGFTQRPGFDFNETFAPVARLDTIRLLAALSTEMGATLHQMDVTTAYLHGEIDEELYMEAPTTLKEALEYIVRNERRDSPILQSATSMLGDIAKGDQVCQLRKAIYGLKQSGRKWYERLKVTLQKLGLEPTISDPCLFQCRKDGRIILVGVYVDDILAVSNDETWVTLLKQNLDKEFEIKDLGEAKYCLGIEIKQEKGKISLSQGKYVDDLLKKFNMRGCNPQNTPASPTSKLKAGNDAERRTTNPRYRELIGSLMYLSVATRPDIAHSVSVLSQFNEHPTEEHWGAAKRVLRYLKGTTKLGLVYRRPVGKIIGYTDADWGNDPNDSRSYTGYVFTLGGAAISWKSRKQRTVALSTTEAEYQALTEATKESMYLRGLIYELGIPQFSEGSVYCDNQGAINLTTAAKFHDRTKHVRIKFNFVREAVQSKTIKLLHESSENMIADILTKSLAKERHLIITKALGMDETE